MYEFFQITHYHIVQHLNTQLFRLSKSSQVSVRSVRVIGVNQSKKRADHLQQERLLIFIVFCSGLSYICRTHRWVDLVVRRYYIRWMQEHVHRVSQIRTGGNVAECGERVEGSFLKEQTKKKIEIPSVFSFRTYKQRLLQQMERFL